MTTRSALLTLLKFDLPGYLRQSRAGTTGPAARKLEALLVFLKKCEICPFHPPWTGGEQGPLIRQLHATGYGLQNLTHTEKILRLLLWPMVSFTLLTGFTVRNARAVKTHYGHSLPYQFLRVLTICYRYNIAPSDYYALKLFRLEQTDLVPLYFCQREKDAVLASLQPVCEQIHLVNDKEKFYHFCLDKQLATPHLIAVFRGEHATADEPGALPAADLFRKPPDAFGGAGAQRWRYHSDKCVWSHKGRSLTETEFFEDCRRSNWLVQPVISNHDSLAPLAAGSLATFRIVTCLSAQSGARLIGALLRIPPAGSDIDAYWAGAMVAGVDPDTGTLSAAITRDIGNGALSRRPDNGATIEGLTVPLWSEIVQLVLDGQRKLPQLTSIGWDVALTSDGPLIIEANVGWNFEMFQVGIHQGLGETAFLPWARELLGQRDN